MEDRFVNPVRKADSLDQNNIFENNGKEKQFGQSFPEILKKEISGNRLSNGVKLTNTTYNLLEYFSETDPLKTKAKEKALAIMDNLVLVFENKNFISSRIFEDIDMLLNYFKLAELQGWISKINYLIISNEYEKIKEELSLNKENNEVAAGKEIEKKSKPFISNFSDRQKKILKFLQEKEKAQVMDLQTVLSDVTKRTIRRDLDELLKIGKIVRTGEWNQVFYKMS